MTRRLTDHERLLRQMSEEDLSSWVYEVGRLSGWRVAHFRPARTKWGWRTPAQYDGAGWPDLIMLKLQRGIAAELKQEVGPGPTAEQARWLQDFQQVLGFETYVWRPRDQARIIEVLTGRPASQLTLLGAQ